jgi:4-amino-4-deoxy-L-arabinose transferase-like glycosyltransferase
MNRTHPNLDRVVGAFVWTTIVWVVVFWRLGYTSLLDPDEAHYAQLTREMVRAGNWLVPLLDARPFIDKPVLFHWLQGLSLWVLGPSEFAARLPTALSAVGLLALTRWTGRSLFSRTEGDWGALMLATMPLTFVLASVALFDMVFTLCLFGAVACLIVAAERESRRTEVSGYCLLTVAVMTKGPVAWLLVILFVGAAHVAGSEVRARLSWLRWRTGAALVLLAASPWFIWMFLRFGDRFVQGYILAGNLWYVTQPMQFSGRAVSYSFYGRALAGGLFPWFLLLIIGSGLARLSNRSAPRAAERMLWVWIAVVVVFFSAARFKLDHYIYPAAPACAILAAATWRRLTADRFGLRGLRASLGLLAGVLFVAGIWLEAGLFELNLDLPTSATLLPTCLVVGGCGLGLYAWRPRPTVSPIPLILMLTTIYAIAVGVGLPALEHTRSTAAIARRLTQQAVPEAPVALYRLEQWRASLRYYLDRPLTRVDSAEQVRAFLSESPSGYVLMLRRDFNSLQRDGLALRSLGQERCVVGTSGRGLRKQRWGYLLIATSEPDPMPAVTSLPDGASPDRTAFDIGAELRRLR